MKNKISFKTKQPTGQFRSFANPIHYIKLNKKIIGQIDPEKPFKIRLSVIKTDKITDDNPNCPWKWIILKKEFESLQETKDFLSNPETLNLLLEKYTFQHLNLE